MTGHIPISVVLATYNGARYLPRQLESLARQTHRPLELVVGDDGSDDGTLALLRNFAEMAPFPVRIERNAARLGFRDNFLRAASRARGDLVAFCDQDDIWRPEKLARCAMALRDPHVVLVAHQADLIDAEDRPVGAFAQGILRSRVVPPLSLDPWRTYWGFSMVFRRDLLSLADAATRFVDFIDPRHGIAHDRWVMFLAHNAGCIAEIAEPLALYRQHDDNLFGVRKGGRQPPLAERSRAYALAARRMADIVRAFPDAGAAAMPALDRAASIAFHDALVRQADHRLAMHAGRSGAAALRRLAGGLARGRYRAVNGAGLLWRSIGRDLRYAVRGR